MELYSPYSHLGLTLYDWTSQLSTAEGLQFHDNRPTCLCGQRSGWKHSSSQRCYQRIAANKAPPVLLGNKSINHFLTYKFFTIKVLLFKSFYYESSGIRKCWVFASRNITRLLGQLKANLMKRYNTANIWKNQQGRWRETENIKPQRFSKKLQNFWELRQTFFFFF